MDDCQKMWGLEKRRKNMWNFKLHPFHFQVDWSNPQNLVFQICQNQIQVLNYLKDKIKKRGKSENSLLNTTAKKNHIYKHIRCWNFGVKLLNNTSVGDDDRLKRELEAFFSVCVGCKYPESKSKKNTRFFREIDFTEKIFIFSM